MLIGVEGWAAGPLIVSSLSRGACRVVVCQPPEEKEAFEAAYGGSSRVAIVSGEGQRRLEEVVVELGLTQEEQHIQ